MTITGPQTRSPPVQNQIFSALLCPLQLVTFPIALLARKVGQLAHYLFFYQFAGYFVHMAVFSWPSWQNSFVKRKIIDCFNQGPMACCCSTFDFKRLEHARKKLDEIGAIRQKIPSPVGEIDTMRLRYVDVKAKIEHNGGQILEHIGIDNIATQKNGKKYFTTCTVNPHSKEFANLLVPGSDAKKWESFCETTLEHLGLESAEIKLSNGKILKGYIQWTGSGEKKAGASKCFIRFNSPGERFDTSKRDIMRRVLAGHDAVCFDPPSSGESDKTVHPSEGAYYLAGEAVLAEAKKLYPPSSIWLDGFCLGGAVASYLWCQDQSEGLNFFGQNNFDKMENVLRRQVFPANYLTPPAIEALKDLRWKVVEQDGFDSVKKLQKLRIQEKKGNVVLVNIDNDKTINPKSQELLYEGFYRSGAKVDKIMRHGNPKLDGHREDILSDRETFQRAWTVISAT